MSLYNVPGVSRQMALGALSTASDAVQSMRMSSRPALSRALAQEGASTCLTVYVGMCRHQGYVLLQFLSSDRWSFQPQQSGKECGSATLEYPQPYV